MWRQGGPDFANRNDQLPRLRGYRPTFTRFGVYHPAMDPILHIPDRPRRRSALLLPFLLGLTVLLYTVLLMPVRQDGATGPAATAAP